MDGSHSSSPAEIRRKRFSAADVQIMLKCGVLKNGERIELVWGELVEMSPQGPLHWDLTQQIVLWLFRNTPQELAAAADGPLRLDEHNEPEPELFLYPAGLRVNDVRGADVVLVVEVSHSSLSYDLGVKASLYADHGVREYWVVDVENHRTLVHRLRGKEGYGEPEAVGFDAPLSAPGGRALIIADLAPKN